MNAVTGTTWAMFAMQVRVEQRIFWRNLSSVFFTFVLPLVLLLALWVGDDPAANVQYIVALSVFSTGFQGLAIQVAMHRDQGVLKGLMSTPLRPSVLIMGKAVSVTIVILVEGVLIVALSALLFGASFPDHLLALLAFVLLGTATFVSLGFALASLVPNAESAPAVANAAYIGILLSSILLGTINGVPRWLQVVGDVIPFSPLVEGVERAWVGPWHGVPWTSAGILAAWLVVGVAWTIRRFRWDPSTSS
ncbi:MAG: ABC transporter permease [Thermoleophilia bacterium]|nr:ABC transporter permease [Thermoleophilia bacterium]